MNVLPIPSGVLFQSHLKDLYKKGKIKVDYGLYGDRLTKKNVTDEHLKPRSWGGGNEESNIALASFSTNTRRGNRPIEQYLTYSMLRQYLKQFIDVKVDGFDGNKYIEGIRKTITELINA